MAHFRKLANVDAGFDANRYLQVVPARGTTRLYLIAGDRMNVQTDHEGVATAAIAKGDSRWAHGNPALSAWEKGQTIQEVTLKVVAPGETKLRGTLDGKEWASPVDVVVVNAPPSRRVGAAVSPDIRLAIQGVSLREAVLMVAEDQMNSDINQD